MVRTLVKLAVFFVLGAVACVVGVEVAARTLFTDYPPLAVLTGAQAATRATKPQPEVATAPSTAKWNILWLSPAPVDTEALSTGITRSLGEAASVRHVGHPSDTVFGLQCRLARFLGERTRVDGDNENEGAKSNGAAFGRPKIVVVDPTSPSWSEANSASKDAPDAQDDSQHNSQDAIPAHAIDAPCVFDANNIARTQLPAAPWDDALAFSRGYQVVRIHFALKALPPAAAPEGAATKISTLVLEQPADPVFVLREKKSLKPTDERRAYTLDDDDPSKRVERLVDHIRERAWLLKTDATRGLIPDTLSPREQLSFAAKNWGALQFDLAGASITKDVLEKLASTPEGESLEKTVRVQTRRPVDLADFLLLLDDALMQAHGLFAAGPVVVTPGRARRVGVFVHPDDVFKKGRPRIYPSGKEFLPITEPKEPEGLVPAKNGEVLGPNWYLRFKNPEREKDRMTDLVTRNPKFGRAVSSLVKQLKRQGAEVTVESTVRAPERGYLMWGAFWLSRSKDEATLNKRISELKKLRRKWKLRVPIEWSAGDFDSTIRAAREMADTYGVVYATKRGAEKSDHYDGDAVDITAVGLPARLTLRPPGKRARTFDLSGASESRDLSVSPALVKFIERGFKMKKLKGDYPHWSTK